MRWFGQTVDDIAALERSLSHGLRFGRDGGEWFSSWQVPRVFFEQDPVLVQPGMIPRFEWHLGSGTGQAQG